MHTNRPSYDLNRVTEKFLNDLEVYVIWSRVFLCCHLRRPLPVACQNMALWPGPQLYQQRSHIQHEPFTLSHLQPIKKNMITLIRGLNLTYGINANSNHTSFIFSTYLFKWVFYMSNGSQIRLSNLRKTHMEFSDYWNPCLFTVVMRTKCPNALDN